MSLINRCFASDVSGHPPALKLKLESKTFGSTQGREDKSDNLVNTLVIKVIVIDFMRHFVIILIHVKKWKKSLNSTNHRSFYSGMPNWTYSGWSVLITEACLGICDCISRPLFSYYVQRGTSSLHRPVDKMWDWRFEGRILILPRFFLRIRRSWVIQEHSQAAKVKESKLIYYDHVQSRINMKS